MSIDINKIRQHFPILKTRINHHPLIYLDNAATTQKPLEVLDTINNFYKTINSNIHRGIHTLSQLATKEFEDARQTVQHFINAQYPEEIIFTSGTTASINLVAQSFGLSNFQAGDEVILTMMEHHSNIVPWQILRDQIGIDIKVLPINEAGVLEISKLEQLISPKTKLLTLIHVSNSLGTINPIKEICKIAHQHNIPVLVDGAQSIAHLKVDIQDIDCDFYAFSGHKIYGPTGIGVLYGKKEFLEKMPPPQGGGEMILEVTWKKTIYNDLPNKFEAGTPNIAGAIGLKTALNYLSQFDLKKIQDHEDFLLKYATDKISVIPGLKIIGQAKNKTGILSFVFNKIHPHDVGTILDQEGIAIRTGHHCTQPLMNHLKIPGTNRASFAIYNNREDIDRLIEGIEKVLKTFN